MPLLPPGRKRRARWGAAPVAVVVLAAEASASDADLAGFCRERLAGYKVPARFVRRDALPRNAVGKVERRALREALP